MESSGDVRFELNRSEARAGDPLEVFFELEATGWKGEEGTALIADPGHERFAREMFTGLSAAGRILFWELSLGGKPLASLLCLRSGGTLFTLKLGWDTRYSRYSPGVIGALKLMETVRGVAGVALVDSCAVPGSWIEAVWPWRRPLTEGVFPTTRLGNFLTGVTVRVKRLKRRLERRGDN